MLIMRWLEKPLSIRLSPEARDQADLFSTRAKSQRQAPALAVEAPQTFSYYSCTVSDLRILIS